MKKFTLIELAIAIALVLMIIINITLVKGAMQIEENETRNKQKAAQLGGNTIWIFEQNMNRETVRLWKCPDGITAANSEYVNIKLDKDWSFTVKILPPYIIVKYTEAKKFRELLANDVQVIDLTNKENFK